jgi:ribosome-binding factor A
LPSPKTIGRLQAQIQRRVAYCLQFELADPRASFVTVTKVELSKDLARAKVYYSVLGDEADRSKTHHMLQGAAGFVRRQLGRVLETRTIPAIVWEYDPSAEEAANMSRLIAEARKRDAALRGPNAPTDSIDETGDSANEETSDIDDEDDLGDESAFDASADGPDDRADA